MAVALPDVSPNVPSSEVNERCHSCGGEFEAEPGGVTHAYMLSTPGCWAGFGRVLAREYSDPALFVASHRLSVDAYALQHPGHREEARAVQSVWLHATSLWLVMREGAEHAFATAALKALAGRTPLSLPEVATSFAMTHADLLSHPISAHEALTREWASAALDGWSDVHGDIERLAAKLCE